MRKALSLPQALPKAHERAAKMSIRFDLVDLRLFLYVAETASITQGASRANMALASASERIRAMEKSLGVALLDRKPRGVRLTAAGSALERHARIVMHDLEEMRGDLNNFAQGLRSRVRVLANTVATVEFLPPTLAVFLATHPNIDVDLEQRRSNEVIRAISEGVADIGIIAEAVDPPEELETFPFAEDRLVLITPGQHPLSRHREVAFSDTLDHDFIGFMPGTALQKTLDHHAMRAGRRLKLRVRLSNFDSIARMVESGIGVAVLPNRAALRYQQSMAIQIIQLTDRWAPRHFTICVRSFESLPPHAKLLVEHLKKHSKAFSDLNSSLAKPRTNR
jgi:DNA-binding transcriptional LysR family regulator